MGKHTNGDSNSTLHILFLIICLIIGICAYKCGCQSDNTEPRLKWVESPSDNDPYR